MLMASRIAVPPRESMRATPSCMALMSLVMGTSSQASSLKLTMKTSSCGLEAFTISSEATSTFCRFSFMLPLLSMMMPNDTGTSSRLKILIGCSTPFSKTLNELCFRSVISLPRLSATLIGKTTSRVSARNVTSSAGGGLAPGFAAWGLAIPEKRRKLARKLLSRRIISKAVERLEWRQAARLYQFHLNMTVFAIPHLVLGRVVKHVLIPQLGADLGGDIGKFIDVLNVITSPSG